MCGVVVLWRLAPRRLSRLSLFGWNGALRHAVAAAEGLKDGAGHRTSGEWGSGWPQPPVEARKSPPVPWRPG